MTDGIDYIDAINSIMEEVSDLERAAESVSIKALNEIGAIVADSVRQTASRSEEEFYWYKKEKHARVHIADDVVTSGAKKSRKQNKYYVSVSGGKKTWHKWQFVSDGHVAKNGTYVPGNHFDERALLKAQGKIDSIVDGCIGEVIKNG